MCGRPGSLTSPLTLEAERKARLKKAAAAKKPAPQKQDRRLKSLSSFGDESYNRVPIGIGQLDELLGGGLPLGKVIQLTGQPGIGKSTLLAQVANAVKNTLYLSAEELGEAVATRARRLRLSNIDSIHFAPTCSMDRALAYIQEGDYKLAIIDSLQAFRFITPEEEDATDRPAFVQKHTNTNVRDIAMRFISAARDQNLAIIMVCHVNKEGDAAGLKEIEHMVDVAARFEGIKQDYLRRVLCDKNRCGGNIGIEARFWMTSVGLVEEPDDPEQALREYVAQGLIKLPKQQAKMLEESGGDEPEDKPRRGRPRRAEAS